MDVLAPPRRRAGLWALRGTLAAHLLVVLGQPVLAGLFLTGDLDAVGRHAMLGSSLAAVALGVVAAALLHVALVRRQWWVPAAATALFLADGLQIGWGYGRELALHVPVGVAIVVASVLFAAWAWRAR